MMDTCEVTPEGTVKITASVMDALADTHEEWSVEIEKISGRTLIEAERKQFHPNGSSATALALDHPKKAGWEVLAPGNRDVRWEAPYETAIEAASTLAAVTHIFEGRRAVNHERPDKSITKAYYKLEEDLLESLKQHGASGSPEQAGERIAEVLHDG